MRKILGILTCFCALPWSLSCGSPTQRYFVKQVHDGDTLTLSDGKVVRVFGVDSPEISNQFNDFNETTGLEKMYGLEAKVFVHNWLLNKEINYYYQSTDIYGRFVARVIFQSQDLGLELVGRGLAKVAYISVDKKSPFYTDEFAYYRLLLETQYKAYLQQKGFWQHMELMKTIFPKG